MSAVVFVGIIASATFIGGYYFVIVFAVVALVVLFEYLNLNSHISGRVVVLVFGGLTYAVFAADYFFSLDNALYFTLIPMVLFFFLKELSQPEKNRNLTQHTVFAVVYTIVPFGFLLKLAFTSGNYSYAFPLAILVFVWLYDAGAYIVGSLLGKHKMFPNISPNKSWEGTIGGLIISMLSAIIYAQFFDILNLFQWIIYALIVSLSGLYGDLFESVLKRRSGVKDSGTIMPGHGGMLDRFDSFLPAVPAVLVYLEVLKIF